MVDTCFVTSRLVLLHLLWRDQNGKNDPGLTTINHVVILIAEASRSLSHRHRCGVGVGGTDAEVCGALIGAVGRGSVRTAGTPDPVVARPGLGSQVSACLLREIG